jgi:hypothetical protein
MYKELLKTILDKYSTLILNVCVTLFVMFLFFSFSDYLKLEIKKSNLTEEVVNQPLYRISTQKSKNYVKCIYEQLECYNKNLGYNKVFVLEACKDLDYCEISKESEK